MEDQNGAESVSAESQQWFDRAPRVVDALKRGSSVSITTWGGREVSGSICDREQTGLLLDVRTAEGSAGGYLFLPWTSIEQVVIKEVSQRQVKFLPG